MYENVKNELKQYESRLENKDERIDFRSSPILEKLNNTSNPDNTIVSIIGVLVGGLIAYALFPEEGAIVPRIIGCFIGVGFATIIHTLCHPEIDEERNEINKTINDLKGRIEEHNAILFANYVDKKLKENNIQNISKEIVMQSSKYSSEKVLIDNKNKTFNIVKYSMPKNMEDNSSFSIKQAKYSEILRYAFLDQSTSTQVATSTTSSNSKKALGGAIMSDLLVGDATTGAIIGGSGARTTETTYKTTIKHSYQITIYLNKLEDSVITLHLTSGDITNKIISTLEYILKNK